MYCKFGNFCEILFSRITLKHIFAMLKICDKGVIFPKISVNDRVISPICEDFIFTKLRIYENKTPAKITKFTILYADASSQLAVLTYAFALTLKVTFVSLSLKKIRHSAFSSKRPSATFAIPP